MLSCQIQLEDKISSIIANQINVERRLEQIDEVQKLQSDKLEETKAEFNKNLQRQEAKFSDCLTKQIRQIDTNLNKTVNELSVKITTEVDQKLYEQKAEIDTKLEKFQNNQTSTIETTQQNLEKLENSILPLINHHKNRLNDQSDRLSKLESTIEENCNRTPSTSTTSPLPIQIICNGGAGLITEMSLPKFNGRSNNPNEYLGKLKQYYKRSLLRKPNQVDETEHLTDIIESSLEHHASRWFNLIRKEVVDWGSFEDLFLEKYWSRDVQRGIKQKLEGERYRPNGSLSRAEYFIERVLTLQSLSPPLNEDEILNILSDHFEDIIQDAKRVQNITTIAAFESLLQREDIKDSHRKPRNKPPQSSNQPPNQNHRNHNNQERGPGYNFHSYQPRVDNRRDERPRPYPSSPPRFPQNPQRYPQQQPSYNQPNGNQNNQYWQRNRPDQRYPTNEQSRTVNTIRTEHDCQDSSPKGPHDKLN